MSNNLAKSKKITLVHGDSDYLVFKQIEKLKKDLGSENINIAEYYGASSLTFNQIYNSMYATDLFMNESTLVIREILDSRSFFPFVEDLNNFLNKNEIPIDIYLFNYSKIAKNTKIFKFIEKNGEVIECNTPNIPEIKKLIQKSLSITDLATELLIKFTNSNLFQIKKEIEKLREVASYSQIEVIDENIINEICIKNFSQNEIWSIGEFFLECIVNKKFDKKIFLKELESLLANNTPVMQILYSFYQNILNAIKLKLAIKEGKNFKECLTINYFFVKKYFEKNKDLDLNELNKINSLLLNYEYDLKNGFTDELIGIRNIVAQIIKT